MKIKLAGKIELDKTEMRAVYAAKLVGMMDAGEPVMALDADLMRPIGVLPYKDTPRA